MTFKGYDIEKTGNARWYITSKKYKITLGPFKTRKHAIEYAEWTDSNTGE